MICRKLFYVLLTTTLFAACSQKETSDGQPMNGTATFQVRLTDYPAHYEAILIEILEVHVHSSSGGWQAMQTNSGVYNLLQLTQGMEAVIATDQLPAGTISQIRFVLGTKNQMVIKGDSISLQLPVNAISGITLNLHYELMPGISYAVLLDFDAAQSIRQTAENEYQLNPVLRVVTQGTDGSIQGRLQTKAFALIYAIDECSNDTLQTYTDSEGRFTIYGMKEGYYQVDVWPVEPYKMQTMKKVMVINGVITDLGIIAP